MKKYNTESKVEAYFRQFDPTFEDNLPLCKTQVLSAENYIILGQMTALRFLEWVSLNPGGVVSLPTGKTPEFFIKWLQYYLNNWDEEKKNGLLAKIGITSEKPDLKSLHFFQLNEFFPINPEHERSFRYFVQKYYIELLGFDPKKSHLINTYFFNEKEREMLDGANNLNEIFEDGVIDLSLRIRPAKNKAEAIKQRAIRIFDDFCARYEEKIRDLGGIGFFLGGIGPDGHIGFNVRGSSHFSHTRLTGINYETMASAATDLGGIELVRKKAVITMGLETITFNPDCVAIIMAAGAGKGKTISNAVLHEPSQEFPATCLQKLHAARFFATVSAANGLPKSDKFITNAYQETQNAEAFIEKLVLDVVFASGKTIDELIAENYSSPKLAFLEQLSGIKATDLLKKTKKSIETKIQKGLQIDENEVILHTAPHHDDIELAYFPYLHHLVRSKTLQNHFVYCTSGYTSVTTKYLRQCYDHILERIEPIAIALHGENVETLYSSQYADDVTLYLRGIAQQDLSCQDYAVARRIARKWVEKMNITKIDDLKSFILSQVAIIDSLETGRKEPDSFHIAKAWLREFEAELVWAHFGLGCDRVSHLRLPFYSDDIFPHYPDFKKDVQPALELLERIKPTIVTLALDPEGSGPDTHFKTLIALSQAIDAYHERHPEINLRVWGYRNVWSNFNISEVNTLIPISLNSFAVLNNMFNSCYLSQRSADFPSPSHDGPFSEVAQKNWVRQHNDMCKLMGEDYFYKSNEVMLRRTYGFIYLKDMTYDEFKAEISHIKKLLDTKQALQQ